MGLGEGGLLGTENRRLHSLSQGVPGPAMEPLGGGEELCGLETGLGAQALQGSGGTRDLSFLCSSALLLGPTPMSRHSLPSFQSVGRSDCPILTLTWPLGPGPLCHGEWAASLNTAKGQARHVHAAYYRPVLSYTYLMSRAVAAVKGPSMAALGADPATTPQQFPQQGDSQGPSRRGCEDTRYPGKPPLVSCRSHPRAEHWPS